MLEYAEIVATLQAEGFVNGVRATSAKILKSVPDGYFKLQVDGTAKGVPEPTARFSSEAEARKALLDFWSECNRAFSTTGSTGWIPKLNL